MRMKIREGVPPFPHSGLQKDSFKTPEVNNPSDLLWAMPQGHSGGPTDKVTDIRVSQSC